MKIAGLFAGIGGIERGLHAAGHETSLLCEIDDAAQIILGERFPGIPVSPDVRLLQDLPSVDIIAAGFPCQDLSQAGKTAGIAGANSGLVSELFRSVRDKKPEWLLLENVPFMLQLDKGSAMRFLTDSLGDLGYIWAYRIVDTRSFGLPQRRRRVIILASTNVDPRDVLMADDKCEPSLLSPNGWACGFYWTEGLRGLGWAVDAVPTLKGGSTIGIPSPPALWDPRDGSITIPDLRDAERLQGFDEGWTAPAAEVSGVRQSHRWKLVGNAVSVPVAEWIGRRLIHPTGDAPEGTQLQRGVAWPRAAWGHKGHVYS